MQTITLNIDDSPKRIGMTINGGKEATASVDDKPKPIGMGVGSPTKQVGMTVSGGTEATMSGEAARVIRAVSPTVDLERLPDGVQITVTDVNGTETETVYDGQGGGHCFLDTTENWNARVGYIPLRSDIIVYTDHGQMDDGYGNMIDVPGVKIGDGNAYLIDLPFVGADVRYQILQELRAHSGNTLIHVTPEDRAFWNNKLNCTVNNGNLILNRL